VARDLPEYLVGKLGVTITQSPLHTPDGGLLTGQNVEYIRDQGLGGLGTRGGLGALNTSALAGSVLAIVNLPFDAPSVGGGDIPVRLLVYRITVAGSVQAWIESADGATFSTVAALTKFPTETNPTVDSISLASLQRKLWFKEGDTGQGQLIAWNGTSQVVRRDFMDPYLTNEMTTFMLAAEGRLYYTGAIPGGASYAVYSFEPNTGQITQIGNLFTAASVGRPVSLAWAFGRLWALVDTIGSTSTVVYSILPGQETTWTQDSTGTVASPNRPGFMVVSDGELFATTYSNDGTTPALVRRRTTSGWATSLTAADNGSRFGHPIVFNGELFVGYDNAAGTGLDIRKWDGSSWSVDKDIQTDFALTTPTIGQPVVFLDALYWPFHGGTSMVAKRTAAGVWSAALAVTAAQRYESCGVTG
jgi:hypothetical protein